MQDFTSDSNTQQSTVSLAFLRLSQVFDNLFYYINLCLSCSINWYTYYRLQNAVISIEDLNLINLIIINKLL